MRRSRRHILLACWLVVQLLFGQQLALAHMVDHVGDALAHAVAGADAGASDEDSEHGGAEALTHVCSACASGLGADMYCPLAGSQPVSTRAAVITNSPVPWRRRRLSARAPRFAVAHLPRSRPDPDSSA